MGVRFSYPAQEQPLWCQDTYMVIMPVSEQVKGRKLMLFTYWCVSSVWLEYYTVTVGVARSSRVRTAKSQKQGNIQQFFSNPLCKKEVVGSNPAHQKWLA